MIVGSSSYFLVSRLHEVYYCNSGDTRGKEMGYLSGLARKGKIRLLGKVKSVDDLYIFDFTIPDGVTWTAGEHALFILPGHSIKGRRWRAFSVASIPEEGLLRIATRISDNPSPYKAFLRDAEPGQTLSIRGPFGWFVFRDESSPVVMIAGGIGITPCRALVRKNSVDSGRDVVLIYSSPGGYLFKNEFDSEPDSKDGIEIHYTSDRVATFEAAGKAVEQYGPEAFYFISGARTMYKSVKKELKKQGIRNNRIVIDPFLGY